MAVTSNWCRCTSCHAGYGWKDAHFDLSDQNKIDCLVCHDTTKTYKKFPTSCGYPPLKDKVFAGKKLFKAVDLAYVAQHVGQSSLESCGKCHFYSGGGDGVKRGDLDSTLLKANKELDVHMDRQGLNFRCTTCHTTFAHRIDGRHYTSPPPGQDALALPKDTGHRVRCASCHGESPHHQAKLNHHTRRVACETCHIPFYARGKPTNVYWDWSTAGKFAQGKPIVKKGPWGLPVYHTKKGTLKWAKNVKPVYLWYNGSIRYTLPSDKIDDSHQPVALNHPQGNPKDPQAKIYPFKAHLGKQPYDPVYKHIAIPKLFGPKGSGAFWAEYDWTKAVAAGMKAAGLPFSGKVGFIETVYYLPLAHMVPPKDKALKCADCHSRKSRLAGIKGVYIPGRDHNPGLDRMGWALVGLALVVVLLHGLGRIFFSQKGS